MGHRARSPAHWDHKPDRAAPLVNLVGQMHNDTYAMPTHPPLIHVHITLHGWMCGFLGYLWISRCGEDKGFKDFFWLSLDRVSWLLIGQLIPGSPRVPQEGGAMVT